MFYVILLVILFGLILVIKTLDWRVSVLLAVVLVVGVRLLGRRILEGILFLPFKAKGAVLHEAEVLVHSVHPAEPPPRPSLEDTAEENGPEEELEEEEDDRPRRYYQVDVTVKPHPPRGKFTHWEPGELVLVPPDTEEEDQEEVCRVYQLEVEQDGRFQPDEGYKFEGPQRLRLHIGVIPGTQKLTFAYYFEEFGEILIPEPQSSPI